MHDAVRQLGGELLARLLVLLVQLAPADADALQQGLGAHLDAVEHRGGQQFGEDARGLAEGLEVAQQPGALEVPECLGLGAAHERRQRFHELVLLHPAARKGVELEDAVHAIPGLEVLAPGGHLRRLGFRRLRRTGLVEQHEHRLAHPAEDLHLGGDVAGRLGRLGGVDQIQHDVGLLADVLQRLLAAPQRLVGEPVPGLRKEPQHRVPLQAQPLEQAGAVAEARRVPQAQQPRVVLEQAVGFVEQRDVGGIPDFAHVPAQQRARQRRLARIGVGDQAERDDVRVGGLDAGRRRHGGGERWSRGKVGRGGGRNSLGEGVQAARTAATSTASAAPWSRSFQRRSRPASLSGDQRLPMLVASSSTTSSAAGQAAFSVWRTSRAKRR